MTNNKLRGGKKKQQGIKCKCHCHGEYCPDCDNVCFMCSETGIAGRSDRCSPLQEPREKKMENYHCNCHCHNSGEHYYSGWKNTHETNDICLKECSHCKVLCPKGECKCCSKDKKHCVCPDTCGNKFVPTPLNWSEVEKKYYKVWNNDNQTNVKRHQRVLAFFKDLLEGKI